MTFWAATLTCAEDVDSPEEFPENNNIKTMNINDSAILVRS